MAFPILYYTSCLNICLCCLATCLYLLSDLSLFLSCSGLHCSQSLSQALGQWASRQLQPMAMDPDHGGPEVRWRGESRVVLWLCPELSHACSCLSAVALTPVWWPFPWKREVINSGFILIRWLQLWGLAILLHTAPLSPGSLALLLLGCGFCLRVSLASHLLSYYVIKSLNLISSVCRHRSTFPLLDWASTDIQCIFHEGRGFILLILYLFQHL